MPYGAKKSPVSKSSQNNDSEVARLVSGRLLTYFQEAETFAERGDFRAAYDYAMLALNSTMFELAPGSDSLLTKLDKLSADGKLGKSVGAAARSSEFLLKHERGITDMDLSYMTHDDLDELLRFLLTFYGSLREHGVAFSDDPRGQ